MVKKEFCEFPRVSMSRSVMRSSITCWNEYVEAPCTKTFSVSHAFGHGRNCPERFKMEAKGVLPSTSCKYLTSFPTRPARTETV